METEAIELHITRPEQKLRVKVKRKPDKNCKRCLGRGLVAWTADWRPVMCKCCM